MKKDALLSVIIPVYKVEVYLDECVSSVVSQTWRNLEIILVDDGSPDRCGEMCDRWAESDSRIKVIHRENGGLGYARNSGLEVASGDFVAFVDSDDYIKPKMYEILMTEALAEDADIVSGNIIDERQDGSLNYESDFPERKVFEGEEIKHLVHGFVHRLEGLTERRLSVSVAKRVYRRDIIRDRFCSEREIAFEDVAFHISAVLNAHKVIFLPDFVYFYRYNSNSLSTNFFVEKFERVKKLVGILNELFGQYGKPHAADYYMMTITIDCLQAMYLYSSAPFSQKKLNITAIANDSVWDGIVISPEILTPGEKLILSAVKAHSPFRLLAVAEVYYRFRAISKFVMVKK